MSNNPDSFATPLVNPNIVQFPASDFELPIEVKIELWARQDAISLALGRAVVQSKNYLIDN